MNRQTACAMALVLASALLSGAAWGQTTTIRQWVANPINVASEYFGAPEGREVGRDVKGRDGGLHQCQVHTHGCPDGPCSH